MSDKGYPVVCRRCSYDRAGLALSTPCPECGSTSIQILDGSIAWHPRWLVTIAICVAPIYLWAIIAIDLKNNNYPPDPFEFLNTAVPACLFVASLGVAALDACASVTYSRRETPILATRIYNVISLLWLCFMVFLSATGTMQLAS